MGYRRYAGGVLPGVASNTNLIFYTSASGSTRIEEVYVEDTNGIRSVNASNIYTGSGGAYPPFYVSDIYSAVYVATYPGSPFRTTLVPSDTPAGSPHSAIVTVGYGDATYARVARPLTMSYIGDSQVPSTTYSYGASVHWAGVARVLLGQRYTDGVVAGIGGQTSDQIAARISTITAGGQSICLLDGGVNDLAAGTAASAITPNLQAMIDACKAAGVMPVVLTALPSQNINTAAKLLEQNRLNTWIRALPATQGVKVIDWASAVVDWASTTGAWIAAYTLDGTHPNEVGHVILGKYVAAQLAPLVNGQEVPLLSSAGTNSGLITLNPGMNGSGGTAGTGVTGTVPASWTVNPIGSTTTTASVEARTDGVSGNWLKLDMTAGSALVFQQNTNVGTDWAIGDTVWLEAEVLISTAPTNMRAIYTQLDFWNGIGSVVDAALSMPPSTALPLAAGAAPLVLRTKPTVIPASTARLQAYLNITQSAASITATIRVGRMAIRKVV